MNYQLLRDEILTGPLAATLLPYVVDQNAPKQNAYLKDKAIADSLNADSGIRIVEDHVNAVFLMSRLGAMTGATILDKLETAALSSSPVKWAMKAINSDKGINVGDPETRAMLDELTVGLVLTAAEATAIKQLAERPSSRAYESVGQPVTAGHVSIALRGDANFTPV